MEYDTDKAAIRCIYAALAITVILTVLFWGEWLAVTICWVFAIPLSLGLGWFYGFIGDLLGFTPVGAEDKEECDYLDDEEIEVEEDPRFWLSDNDSGIIYSDEIIGTFMDANIHEWVLIDKPESEGIKIKCLYETIVDMNYGFNPPNDRWFILLEPGILYVAEPENTVAEAEIIE